jgi:hypothetical protein
MARWRCRASCSAASWSGWRGCGRETRSHTDARRGQRKAARGRAAPGVRPRGAAVRPRTARGDVPDPCGGRHDGRTPLPARSQGHYASPGTGMGYCLSGKWAKPPTRLHR